MPTEKLTFEGHDGVTLAARLDLPQGEVLATAVFAHCFTCGKDIAAARRVAGRLAASGIAVMRFDFTGLGHSGGEFENSTFSGNVADLVLAGKALEERLAAPSLIVGHSLGGAAVVVAAPKIPSIKAVATIAAPFDPGHVVHQFGQSLEEIEEKGSAEVKLAGRPFTIGRDFVHDVRESKLTTALKELDAGLLVLHSPGDETVRIDNASGLFTAAKHPKSFVTLDGADHLLTRAEDAEYAAAVIVAWAERYLDLQPEAAPDGVPEGVVRVAEADPNGFLQDVSVGEKHALLADEPESFGGTDRGMTPYNFLAAGLGACTSMTIRLYARRKGIDLKGVSVDIMHDKVHADDARVDSASDTVAKPAKIDAFERVVHLEGDLDAETRGKLLEIADKCPVHRTLEKGAKVITRLA